MLKNYLIIILRNIVKQKMNSFIKVSGMAAGLMVAIFIISYFNNEISYDSFHKNAEDIYLVYTNNKTPEGIKKSALSPDPLPAALKNDYPQISGIVSFFGTPLKLTANKKMFEENCLTTESAFFKMFNFKLLAGNPLTALDNPNSAVVTKKTAFKYWGGQNPVGKVISIMGKDFIVTGLIGNFPANSSITGDILLSANLREIIMPGYSDRWHASGTMTFIKLNKNISPKEIRDGFSSMEKKYLNDFLQGRISFGIQPITSMHLDSSLENQFVQPNNIKFIGILLTIAIGIILIVVINFINLSVSGYTYRIKEIGIRKVLGAKKSGLIKQFILESVFISLLSLLLAFVMCELLNTSFNRITGREINPVMYNNLYSTGGWTLLAVIIGILTGIYPAFYLSSLNTITLFKTGLLRKWKKINVRWLLIIVQFSMSLLLIITGLFISKQLSFMRNYNLGFDSNRMMVIELPYNLGAEKIQIIDKLMNSIQQNKARLGIESSTVSAHVPGYYYNNKFGVIPEGQDKTGSREMIVTATDSKFNEVYNLKLLKGRYFSEDYGAENQNVIINETAAAAFGWKEPVGKKISFIHEGFQYNIIGVIKDIHFRSMQNRIEPLVINYNKDMFWNNNFISVSFKNNNQKLILSFLNEEWNKLNLQIPMDYFFISDKYAASYVEDERTEELINISSIIASFFACIGLFGISSVLITQRTKEIGIRKSLGASVSGIVFMLTRPFLIILIISAFIAIPCAYLIVKNFLSDYPYHISIGIDLFLFGFVLILVLIIISAGIKSLRAAFANPVETLRYE